MAHNNALVISKWWAGVFASLAATSAISAFGFAWSANSQQTAMQVKVEAIEQANLPDRMARIEETVKSTDKTVDDIKATQREQSAMQMDMSRKIDQLIQNGRTR
jgi:hypothetical protein